MAKKETPEGIDMPNGPLTASERLFVRGIKVRARQQCHRGLEVITDCSISRPCLFQPVRACCDVCGLNTEVHDTLKECMDD